MDFRPAFRLSILILLPVLLTACAPSLAPLFRDFEFKGEPEKPEAVRSGIETALRDAGWQLASPSASNVVTTKMRSFNNWGLYKVEAPLEVAPISDKYVRVFVHPYRKYITGGRGKIPFMKGSVRRAILPDLTKALEVQGLVPIGSADDHYQEDTGG